MRYLLFILLSACSAVKTSEPPLVITDKIVTGGQPSAARLDAIPPGSVVVSLRSEDELGTGWEGKELIAKDVSFFRVPVNDENLTASTSEKVYNIFTSSPRAEHYLFCGTGNRAGALIALMARYQEGKPAAESIQLGKKHGLSRSTSKVVNLIGTSAGADILSK